MAKKNHGGIRKNAGRKPEYGEPTTTIAFRVPISWEARIKKMVNSLLIKLKNKHGNLQKTV